MGENRGLQFFEKKKIEVIEEEENFYDVVKEGEI